MPEAPSDSAAGLHGQQASRGGVRSCGDLGPAGGRSDL